MPKLTKRAIDAATPRDKIYDLMDSVLPGFGVRVSPSGHKSFTFRYRPRAGRGHRRQGLGAVGTIGLDEARRAAQKLYAKVLQGEDPVAERAESRQAATIAELMERVYEAHWVAHRKASTAKAARRLIDRHVIPGLGKIAVDKLTTPQVVDWHQRIGARTPGEANRALSKLSKACTLAVRWGMRPYNPCRGVEKYKENARERILDPGEYRRLWTALADARREGEHVPALDAVELIMLTGLRHQEVLHLQWEHVSPDRRTLTLPDSKTGPRDVPVSPEVAAILARTPSEEGWVFPSPKKVGRPIHSLQSWWERLRQRAGLEGVRIHDLRHSFASRAIDLGAQKAAVGALCGHSRSESTDRYIHPSKAAEIKATSVTAAAIVGDQAPAARSRAFLRVIPGDG